MAYPAIPLGLRAVAGLGLQGLSLASAVLSRSFGTTAFVAFASPTERLQKRWNRLSLVPPLLGFECRPSAGIPSARPLPGAEAPFGPTLPHAGSRSALVVSHHLDVLLRTKVTGLLHPATSLGFAAFRACRFPATPEGAQFIGLLSPRRGSHPSKTSPRQQPYHITVVICLPAVTVLPGAGPDRGRCPCRPPPTEVSGVHPKSLPAGHRVALPRGAGWPVPL